MSIRLRNYIFFDGLPGFVPDTRVTIFFDGNVVCWSVGSASDSSFGHPWPVTNEISDWVWKHLRIIFINWHEPKNVIENFVFFIASSDGPSCEKNPSENSFGYLRSKLRPNENFVNTPKIIPKNETNNTAMRDLSRGNVYIEQNINLTYLLNTYLFRISISKQMLIFFFKHLTEIACRVAIEPDALIQIHVGIAVYVQRPVDQSQGMASTKRLPIPICEWLHMYIIRWIDLNVISVVCFDYIELICMHCCLFTWSFL